MRYDILQDIRQAVDSALRDGTTFEQFRKDLTPILQAKGWWGRVPLADLPVAEQLRDKVLGETAGPDGKVQLGSPRRLRIVYDTNLRTARAAGRWARMERLKDRLPFLRYSAVLDGRTRPLHRSWHGTVLKIDHEWWKTHYPPNGWNCFPAETLVRCDAKVGLKAFYSGEMVEVRTALGHRLAVTANHPVLTRRGWLAARLLKEGDDLLSASGRIDAPLRGIVNDEKAPARAEDLFQALASEGLRIVPMTPHDFDGDALAMKGEIHIAGSYGALVDIIEAARGQLIGEDRLEAALHRRVEAAGDAVRAPQAASVVDDAVLSQNGPDRRLGDSETAGDLSLTDEAGAVERQNAAFEIGVASVAHSPGGGKLPLDAAGRAFDGAPFDAFGLGPSAQIDAGPAQGAAEGDAAAPSLFRKLLEANPGAIKRDQVVEVRKYQWTGHVFDFSTSTGLIVAHKIVLSNCRCIAQQFGEDDLKAAGFEPSPQAPNDGVFRFLNKRTGQTIDVPRGIDPGFAHNVGQAHMRSLTPAAQNGEIDFPRIVPPATIPSWPGDSAVPENRLFRTAGSDAGDAARFMQEFGATPGRPLVFTDAIGEPVVIDESFLQDRAGNWKIGKRGRRRALLLLADTLKDPTEIWWHWKWNAALGRFELRRTYLKTFSVGGEQVRAIVGAEIGRDGWRGTTAFQADEIDAIVRRRNGVLAFRRRSTNEEPGS